MSDFLRNPHQLFNIKGKSAIIVGATGSFGKVVAQTLGNSGARLVITAGNAGNLAELGAELGQQGIESVQVAGRPDSEDNCKAIVDAAVDAYGGVDILVIAAGLNDVSPIIEMEKDRFDKVMTANVDSCWLMAKVVGRQMIEQGRGGKVVFTSSARGKLGHPAGYTAYCASKAATDGLTKSLGCEWGQYGITVNAIAPTVFRSPLTAWMFEDGEEATKVREGFLSRVPIGRLGRIDNP